ncbi:MAG: 3-dehydroquinate synthase [Rhodospirillales bacterium]|jgi:3-dehydroquinate synthase|nr:3-dehydroquinate synthase [Rhodospirillales bacterium]
MTYANDKTSSAASTLRVNLGSRAYSIVVGDGLVTEAGRRMVDIISQRRVVVVTDATVAALYLKALEGSLDEAGIEHSSIVLPAGEATKSFDRLLELTDRLLDDRIERTTTVVALGGGVIGDLAGFAASIVLRGVDVVQIPTTLLAQVDSSVGGKTGINTRHGKNLIGTFHQPILVLADVGTLATLPPRQLLAGYAETVKYGLTEDAAFFDWLERHGDLFCRGDKAIQTEAVIRACATKAAVVAEDERETGRRALLNFGHTFGHALEAECGYGERLLHGEAVALGMVMATTLSVRMGLCPSVDLDRTRRHLETRGLRVRVGDLADSSWTAERLLSHMMSDKKVRNRLPTFVLTRGIGKAFTTQDVDPDLLRSVVDAALSERP